MKKFVNFHTHNLAPREDLIQVYIPSPEENHVDEKANYFCFGVHPWDIFKIKDEQIKTLIKYHCQNPRFLALGEIGLDKFKPSDFKRQQTIFKNQIEIARELNIKKIVLHCVRAYQECYEILKETNFTGALIFHDYQANKQVFEQFNQRWNTYISLSLRGLSKSNAKKNLSNISLNRLFFETDDAPANTINQPYELYAKIFNLEVSVLKASCQENLRTLAAL